MQKIYILILALCFNLTNLMAQCPGCTVSLPASLPTDTIYLSPIPDGVQFQPYDEDLSFRLPTNANQVDPANPSLSINYIRVVSISGLPFGLNTQTSQSADNDKYDLPAEKDGCAKICGTPLQSGTFNVSVNVIANVQIAGDQSLSIPLTMYIAPAASSNNGFSMNPSGGCAPLSVSFTNNNPSNGMSGFSYNWNMGNGYQTTDENPTTQVYTNPGDYPVRYTAVIDTAPYLLTSVDLISTSESDPLGTVDMYIIIKNAQGNQIYNSFPGIVDQAPPLTFTLNPAITLTNQNYTIEAWDEDGGLLGGPDFAGSVNFNGQSSSQTVTVQGTSGQSTIRYNIFHLVTNIESNDTVHVYESPNVPIVTTSGPTDFCAGDTLMLTTNAVGNLQWILNDTTVLLGEINTTLNVVESGLYKVRVTNANGCEAFSVNTEAIKRDLPFSPFFTRNVNTLTVSTAYAGETYTWYKDGVLIPGVTGTSYTITSSGVYEVVATNQYGCTKKFGYYLVVNTTGIEENVLRQAVRISPNPTVSGITINSDIPLNDVQILLYDFTGKNVFSQNNLLNQFIDLSSFKNGAYWVVVKSDKGIVREMLIKQ